jgi:N6-L-threonylcarbamoyladenine synthase
MTNEKAQIPISTQNLWINFSGPETHAKRLIDKGEDFNAVASGVIHCISASVQKVIQNAIDKTGIKEVLMVGGVCSNSIMKQFLMSSFAGQANIHFAQPEFSTDNAAGISLLGLYKLVGSEVLKSNAQKSFISK